MHNRFPLFSDQSNLLYISETIIDKEFYSSMHSHPNLEVLFFIDGEGFVRSSEEKLKVSKHDIVIINANTMHYEDTNNLVHFYAIGINASEIFLHEILYFGINTLYNLPPIFQYFSLRTLKQFFPILPKTTIGLFHLISNLCTKSDLNLPHHV